MALTTANATMKLVAALRDGQKLYSFTCSDVSSGTVAGTGCTITLPQVKTIFGTPIVTVCGNAVASQAAMIGTVVVSGNTISTSTANASCTTVYYTGLVIGK
jgi:hypothetical protein